MKRILIPTDFSVHAEHALKVAAQIAKKNNAEIILLHMLELPTSLASDAMSNGPGIPEIMFFKQSAINKLEDLMDADFLEGITVSEVIKFEKAFEGIIDVSHKNEVDLIVMGSHGASGYKELFIGSNTEKVVRTSDVPVLVIKNEKDILNVDNFVFASDFSDEVKPSFEKVLKFVADFNANLHLVLINTPTNFKPTHVAQEILNKFKANYSIENSTTTIYNDVNVEKGILNFANSINADLIGISTHGRKGLAHFFNGSISEDIVNHSKRAVMTFKI